MVAYLSKSDANEGFNQIIDFLNGSSIKYALTVNPNIYVSCIKQFWTTVAVKQVNDVTRLQALVDKKKVVVMETTIREALRLDDEEGVECLPNEEIFVELAIMGYEKPSTKLTFYKAFFSSQWNLVRNVDSPTKFYMYPRFLQLMIRKQVGNLSTYTAKYTSPYLTQKVFANIRRVGKGFSEVETPLFDSMLVEQQVDEVGDADENDETVNVSDVAEGDVTATHREVSTAVEEPSIPSPTPPTPPPQQSQDILSTSQLTRRVKKLERRNKVRVFKLRRLQRVGTAHRVETSNETVMDDVSNQGRMITEMDHDADVVLEDDKEVTDEAKEVANAVKDVKESSQDQGRTVESQAKIYKIDLDHANKVLSMQEDETKPAEEPKPLKKKQQIEQDEQYARELQAKQNKNIDWDEAINHVKKKAKEDPVVKRYQLLKRKPQTEAQARKNMMVYLKNVAGFKMDYFKGMSYDDIRPVFEVKFNSNVAFILKTKEQIEEDENKALKRLNVTPVKREAKKQKLDEEERFSTTKPKNFSDDFLIVTLGAMFKKLDIHAQIWKTQRNVHGPAKVKGWKLLESCGVQIITFTSTQLILLVERKYPLTRFTLDQMLNVVRLEVEEESEVSLELLRFTRQQHQEGQLE
uniref:Xylulose kinase-1 n=1 Tax=Tanacetum cinerariifolium TaxID=118510 RepID=A0A6L2MRH3_TANCI|nr:xylulose kinase-1 [Tanacetum cinerariifolium]